MKRFFLVPVLTIAISCSVVSCGSKKEKGDKPADTPAATGTTEAPADAPADKKGMSVKEATALYDAGDANLGKEITVSAYSWGSNERTDDKIQLNLGDKKLEGMQTATFACMFSKDQTAAIKAIAKDAMVTVTGKLSKGYSGPELNDCKLVQ